MIQALQVDLEEAISCKATDMMNYLFSFCCTIEGEVLPLKTELQDVFSEVQKLVGNDAKLKELFCDAVLNHKIDSDESEMYNRLIKACNYAFDVLSKLKVPPIPDYNEKTQLRMIRMDRECEHEYECNCKYYANPYLCIVFREWFNTRKNGTAPQEELELEQEDWATPLLWRNVLCPVEVKPGRSASSRPPPPPTSGTTDFWSLDERRVVWPSNETQKKPDYIPVSHTPVSIRINRDNASTRSRTKPVVTSVHVCTYVAPATKKRKREDASDTESSSSRKRTKTSEERDTVASNEEDRIQVAIYSAHRLSSFFDITHTFSMLLRGSSVLLQWSDRQGVIESYEFDYVHHLPHFIFLLLILQRFSPARWGYGMEVTPSLGVKANSINIDVNEDSQFVVEMAPTADPEVQTGSLDPGTSVVRFFPLDDQINTPGATLVGRATKAMGGRIVRKDSTWEDEPNIEERNDCMVKSYWPETQRQSEVAIMKKVKAATEGDNDNDKLYEFIRHHVPEMRGYLRPEFPGSSTATIRRFLKLASGEDDRSEIPRTRYLLLIVFKRLYAIQGLCEDDMIKYYIQAFFCHRALWLSGIYHLDISLGNIMWDKDLRVMKTLGQFPSWLSTSYWMMGRLDSYPAVLHDFDLARHFGSKGATSHENTGTVPFMALDLLGNDGQSGLVPRRYRHDAEAFVWVLVYLCLVFKKAGDKIVYKEHNPLAKWSDINSAGAHKAQILDSYDTILLQFPEPYPCVSDIAWALARDTIRNYNTRMEKITDARATARKMGNPLSSVYLPQNLDWERVDADVWTSMVDILKTTLEHVGGRALLEELKKKAGYERLCRDDGH
ncbi:hypothetical protein CVT24_001722 [Panaeolus cyanescens]|uniref:Fungal-type protein kinase domain-containing protein n=1 Tax=Panaeolus cyanescens TaxID=181874 RepID=A0A409YUB6_9AGAR|nr:hypothetical protein CVT24_001722 [Panaeolus cyanescens]